VPDQGNGTDHQGLKAALSDARRELIDLSRRNRLLHSPLTGKRPHCLDILGVDPDELYVALARAGKPLGFAPAAEDESMSSEAEPARGLGSVRLQTKLAAEPLERRLLKLFREARTFEEEQGVNILFLAIGFLHWYEDPRSEERCTAPLLLVPVSLERRHGRDTFIMRGRDDDMIVNVSLAEKLRSGFGISLPEIPDGDDWLPSGYVDAVGAAVAGQTRWGVDARRIGLGFFTFSKFLMWRDLDANAWPDPTRLFEHILVTQLLGHGSSGELDIPLALDDEPIEPHVDLAAAVHVLDADSSQALCIEEICRGKNLVIQGPPGTGKSQTIANIIAAAVYDGKSVLFVAEKAAALDVVQGRLKSVGLEPLCLEIHSKKATKLSVVASLERSIRAAGAWQTDGRTANELRDTRDRLNAWSATLHREIRRSGRTPYHVIGVVLKLHADGVRVLDQRLDAAADWDRDRLDHAEQSVVRAAQTVTKLGVVPVDHAWYGARGGRLTPFDTDRLRDALGRARNALNELIVCAADVASVLSENGEKTCESLENSVKDLGLLGRVPAQDRELLFHPAWHLEQHRIEQVIERGRLWSTCVADLSARVIDSAWDADAVPIRHAIAAHGKSLFRVLVREYRHAVADMRGFFRGEIPSQIRDRVRLLDVLVAGQAARRQLRADAEFGTAVFGRTWAAEGTSWSTADALLAWSTEARRESSLDHILALAVSVNVELCRRLASELDHCLADFWEAFERMAEIVWPDAAENELAPSIGRTPLQALARRFDEWLERLDDFNDWIAAREALETLRRWDLQLIANGLEQGDIRAAEAKPMTDLLIAEALWRCACADDPTLNEIDGVYRTETVSQFRDLDRRRIEIARSEVMARYSEGRPTGDSGEMGVVRGEIGKKRRHLPIRKLVEKAASALKMLKPVFLMSPLSVAQFLPPGRLTFDLVVMEALGVIARARQMVVVGDDKQLPPTNFFRMASADEDDGEGDEEANVPSARTKDFESILTLARARGSPERMLRWHYRSRHPSLIALSNHECYGGGLLLPPSPLRQADGLGLSLVRTPRGHYDRGGSGRNAAEADQIAAAVEDHLRNQVGQSLGVASFSVAQRDAIEDALQARGVLSAVDAFAPNGERLFIKNLEAVQGDERDVIFVSIGYGPDAHGRMTAGFGPLSADGGERRLNVLISRARSRCVVFSSIGAGDIPADVKPRGTRMLREFLHFAETGNIAAGQPTSSDFDSPFEEAVAKVIQRHGYEIVPQVGVSGFRIDLGVLDPSQPGRFILGVECDGAAYHSGRSARDRDRLRQEVLERLGWRLYRIWSTDWFRNPDREMARLVAAIEEAQSADSPGSRKKDYGQPREQAELLFVAPTVGDPPLKSESPSESYIECKLEVPYGNDFFSLDQGSLAQLAATVVRCEGPIHVEEVARRVREAFGLERTGRRILQSISAALGRAQRQGAIVREGQFWSPKEGGVEKPRSRRDAALTLRRPDRIASQEYRLAINAVLQASAAASKSELTVGVARVLGFDRTGNELDRAISDQIDAMVRAREIEEIGGQLQQARRGN